MNNNAEQKQRVYERLLFAGLTEEEAAHVRDRWEHSDSTNDISSEGEYSYLVSTCCLWHVQPEGPEMWVAMSRKVELVDKVNRMLSNEQPGWWGEWKEA